MQVFEKRLKRQFPHSVRARGKTILEELSSIQLFTGFENPALFSCYVAAEKRAGFSNSVKNHVLEICSDIFFPLAEIQISDSLWHKLAYDGKRIIKVQKDIRKGVK